MQESILQSVGRTPLVRLRRLAEGLPASVYVKVESLNPGGSVKDRVGLAMIAEAERRGWLRPGGTIIEATAGNTGVGLAMVAAVKGYRCIFVLPDKMSEREDPPAEGLRRRGRHHADRRRRPTRRTATTASPTGWPARSPAPGGPTSSPTWPTPRSTTAPPARRSGSRPTGRITAFVAGVGTGGTISGVGRYLKERNPDVKIIGADPEGSVLSGGSPEAVEGRGHRRGLRAQDVQQPARRRVGPRRRRRVVPHRPASWPGARASWPAARSGTAVAAALRYARRLTAERPGRGPRAPTPGRNYLSKFFDDAWLAENKPPLGRRSRRTRSATCSGPAGRASW